MALLGYPPDDELYAFWPGPYKLAPPEPEREAGALSGTLRNPLVAAPPEVLGYNAEPEGYCNLLCAYPESMPYAV